MSNQWMNRLIICLLTISMLSAGLFPVNAATVPEEWQLVGQFGGSTQAVTASGQKVYAGTGLKMNILDFSEPNRPVLLGSSAPFVDFVTDIAISGSSAFVATGKTGLSVVDIGDSSAPQLLGTWESAGYAEAVATNGKLAAVANGPLGLRLIDCSKPTDPKEIGSAYALNYVFDVALAGNFAFIAAGDSGLLIADISDPKNPVEVGSLDTIGYAYGVAIKDKLAYVADAWAGIETVDISKPEEPVLLGNTASNGWSISVSVGQDWLYSGNGGLGVQVFDLTNPKLPKAKGIYNDGGSSRQVAEAEDKFFVADTLKGIRMIDASKPDALTQLGIYSALPYARRATLAGDYLYVAAGTDGAMYVINVADPTKPYQVSKFQADGNASDVAIKDKSAFLTTFMDSSNYMIAIDISEPANLKMTSAVPLGSVTPMNAAPREAVIQGNEIFVADEFGMRIFDISNPAQIRQYGQIETYSSGSVAVGVVVNGKNAYLAASSLGVRVVDVSDLENPKEVGNFSQSVGSLALKDEMLYLGEYGGGIRVASISPDGKSLMQKGSFPSLGQVEDVAVGGTTLFVSEGKAGVQVLDVSNPARISQAQLFETPGYAWSSEVKGNLMYESDGNGGVIIFAKGKVSTSSSAVTLPTYTKTTSLPPNDNIPRFPSDPERVQSTEVCMVSSINFEGLGSLNECIQKTPAGGTIKFDTKVFLPKQPARIVLEAELPRLTQGSVTIDGSDAGVILDGNQMVAWGLMIESSYNKIMGLQFTNFTNGGLQIGFPSSYNVIGGDHTIGDGPGGQGNAFYGNFVGIGISYCHHNTVKGNFIGTFAGGTQAGPYTEQGVSIGNYATYNYIGGNSEGEKNIISGNNRGVDLASNTSTHNKVAGNYVGTDVTGTKAIPNYDFAVLLEVGTRFNIIGGTSSEERNIISGNDGFGLTISDDDTTENTVIGNYIGVDVSGTKALSNRTGMTIYSSQYNRIGGQLPGEGNLISGNKEKALAIYGMGPLNAIVFGNVFGLDSNGKRMINGNGIYSYGGTHSFIGGLGEGSGNLINETDFGIGFEYSASSYNWAAGNVIKSQNGILISNGAFHNYVIKNNLADCVRGISVNGGNFNTLRGNLGNIWLGQNANQSLAAPILKMASASTVRGSAMPLSVIDLFVKDSKGTIYLGAAKVDEVGNFSYSGSVSGTQVIATSTDAWGNTSGFSYPLAVR